MTKDDVLAELTISRANKLSEAGRDALVSWLDETAQKIKAAKCNGLTWNQPNSRYRLSWVQ